MYHNSLFFIIVSESDRIEKAVRAAQPPEDCSCVFKTVSSLTESKEPDTAYIFDPVSDDLVLPVRKDGCEYVAVLSDRSGALADGRTVSAFSDIWVLPEGIPEEPLLLAYFSRLADRMKKTADSRRQGICFNTLIDSVPDIAWFKDTAGAHLIVNSSFCDMVGKSKEQIYKKGHCFIWDATPEDEEVCLTSDRSIMASRMTNSFEEEVVTKNEMLLLKSYKSPLIDVNGEVFGTCGIAHDVTEFRNATTEIQILIDSMPFVVLLEGDDRKVMSKNLYFDEYFPEFQDIIGKSSLEWKNSLTMIESNITDHKEVVVDYKGEQHTLMLDVDPLLDIFYHEKGKIITLTDVTHERRISSELMESQSKAQEANRAKSLFLARMSHEIRTPINSVIGMNEMILRESKEHDIRNYALTSQRSARMLLSLVNDILDFSKIESGKMEIIPAKYTLSELIADVVNMNAPRAYAKGLAVRLEVDPSLPSKLYGDDVRLRQIITNLITNAVKYTKQGTVTLKVSGETEGDSARIRFCVSDTGMGIKQDDLDKLFEAFQRIDEKNTRHIEGTGLGLNITNTLLRLMDSALEVKSEYGKGTDFYFTVKQKIIKNKPVGNIEVTTENEDNFTYSALFSAPEAKVLIVDDNDMNRVVFRSLLKQTHVQVTEAASGQECLRLAENERFDIIFMDHMMPEMDGVETFRRLKEEKNLCKDVPVIVLTANALSGAREAYLNDGFTDFLPKPVSPLKLEQMTKKYLPQELVKAAEVVVEKPAAVLPEINGFNFDAARLYAKSDEAITEALKAFGENLVRAKSLLGHYLAVIDSGEEAVGAFRIQAHALKGAAAVVGEGQISELAKTAEFAAKNGNIDRIKAITPILIEECEVCLGDMEAAGAYVKKPAADASVSGRLDRLIGFMEDFSLDEADGIMKEIYDLSYPDAVQEQVELLKIAVENCDNAGAERIADNIKGLM